jgi:hypothetical protein
MADEKTLEEEQAKLAELARRAEELRAAETGTDLVPVGGQSPEAAKREMAKTKAEAARRMKAVQVQGAKVRAIIERQAKEAERVMQAALAELEPMQEMVRRLEEGIWTVNLYLGTSEKIVQLADGKPASKDTPITVRQLVLSMDEECAIEADSGGIDSMDIPKFDRWLQEDWRHVEQVLPELKGVVALVPRQGEGKDYGGYGGGILQSEVEKENKRTYILIRNGEKLWRVRPNMVVGERLVPTSDEFTDLFLDRGFGGRSEPKVMKPGSKAWENAAKAMEARERHYMRVALVLQGLTDRTPVFHPMPEAGVSFLERQHYAEQRVRFILDAERSLGTGREEFRDWQKRLMGELRVGMRVVGDFRRWKGAGFGSLHREPRDRWDLRGHERLHPPEAIYPTTGELYAIEERRGDDLIFRYSRGTIYDPKLWVESETRPGWGHYGGEREAKQRASCVVQQKDEWVMPFDLVTEAECEAYLRARTERHAYREMFPLLKAVIKAKRREAEEEAPFRTMLAGVLARENGGTVEEAEAELPDLVSWWKLKNRNHRPLVGDEASNAKAVRMIVAEHRRRIEDRHRPIRAEVVAELKHEHPEAVVIVRPRRGGYLVLLPAEPVKNVWVHEVEYSARGELKERREWQLVRDRQTRWTVAHAGARWGEWDTGASALDHLTGPERAQLAEAVRRKHAGTKKVERYDGPLLAITHELTKDGDDEFVAWMRTGFTATLDEAHPLTVRPSEPDSHGDVYGWRRTTGGGVTLAQSAWGGTRSGWLGRHFIDDDGEPGWAWEQGAGEVLYLDEKRIEKLKADRVRYEALQDRRHDLEREAGRWHGDIEAQWLAARERERFEAFLREYSEPELWAGHRKGLKDLRWPTAAQADLLWQALADAVERGVPIKGRTVADLVGDRKVSKGDRENFGLPKGAGDLVFGAEPVQGPWNAPEEDDEPEDELIVEEDDEEPFEVVEVDAEEVA